MSEIDRSPEACWKRFWDIIGPQIAEGIREGRITQDDYDASASRVSGK